MTQKRHRQKDPPVKGEASDSSEDNKARSSSTDCKHVAKFKPRTLKEAFTNECKACTRAAKDKVEVKENVVAEPVNSKADKVDLLACLYCGLISCGEQQQNHASLHQRNVTNATECHDFAVFLDRWTVWCFQCNREVEHPTLECRVNFLRKKFDIPGGKSGKTPASEPEIKSPCLATPYLNKEMANKQLLVKGLMNLGNTCFYNSVLQCLAQTPYLVPILERLSAGGEKFALPKKNELEPLEGELAKQEPTKTLTVPLLDLLKEMRNGKGNNTVRPENLLRMLQARYEQFKGREQHDAHELLRHLLEGVRTDDLKRYQIVILKKFQIYGSQGKGKANRESSTAETRELVKSYGRLVNELLLGPETLFRGQLISTLECQDCKSSSTRTENFLDLSLPVTEEKPLPPARKKELDYPTGPSKHQLKREQKMAKRMAKLGRYKAPPRQSNDAEASNEESGPSDADVEDNVEPDTSLLAGKNDVSESGYSSEKAQNAHSESASPAESGCSFVEPPQPFALEDFEDEKVTSLKEGPEYLAGPTKSDSGLNSSSSLPLLKLSPATSSPPATPAVTVLDTSTATIALDALRQGAGDVEGDAESDDRREDMPKCSPTEGECEAMAQLSLDVSDLSQKLRLLSTASPMADSPQASDQPDQGDSVKETKEPVPAPAPVREPARDAPSSQPSWRCTLAPLNASEGECSVISCLHEFTHVEIMNGSNKVGCDNCTRNKGKDGRTVYTTSTKQLLISAPPAVLILQLKRFIAETCRLKKMNRHVTFPFTLDLAPFCSEKCRELPSISSDQSKVLYSLYGVVEHSGQMYGGHYVAYVKVRAPLGDKDPRWKFLPSDRPFLQTSPSQDQSSETVSTTPVEEKWYYVSDSHVNEVDEERVRRSQAYLLFYERVV